MQRQKVYSSLLMAIFPSRTTDKGIATCITMPLQTYLHV